MQVVIIVFVGVMGPGLVIQLILNELEPRDPYRVKAQVICGTGIVHRYRAGTQVLKGHEPLFEDRRRLVIAWAKMPRILPDPLSRL